MQTRLLIPLMFISISCFSQEITSFVILGNKKTKTSFIKRICGVTKKTKLDSLQLEKDIQKLKRLPGISHAYFTVNKQGENREVIYHIVENFSIIPSVNFYTTNMGEFAYRIGAYEFNGFGKNIQIGGFFQRDIFNSYALLFKAPYIFSSHVGLAVSHQNLTTLEPLYFNNGSADYKYNNISYELMLLWEINTQHRIETGANYFVEEYNYVTGITDENIPTQLTEHKTLLKVFYEYNHTDTNYQYITGIKSQFRIQYVKRINHYSPAFLIGINDLFYFHQAGKKGTWASRFRIGLASNNESPFAPFALDNNINIRGVGNTIDRGTGSIVLNTEYRYTVFEKGNLAIQTNLFIDMGAWRKPGGTLTDFFQSENQQVYPGIGLRFIHKKIYNTIFRIDYGYGITSDATNGFVFGIGQYF